MLNKMGFVNVGEDQMLVKNIRSGLFLAICLSLSVAQAEEPNDKTPSKSTGVDSDKLGIPEFNGKLLSVPSANSDFTVEVVTQQVVPKNPNQPINPGNNPQMKNLMGVMQHIQQLQGNLARAKTPKDIQHIQGQLAQAYAKAQGHYNQALQSMNDPKNNPFKVVTNKNKVDFHAGEEIKVRFLNLPLEFDDKGKPKKYSNEEIKALRGKDTKIPGFEGSLDSLKVGMLVKVVLAVNPPANQKEDPDKTNKDPNKTAHKTVVKMIVVLDSTSTDSFLSGTRSNK